MASQRAITIADAVAAYLVNRGWYRDGDDPGIWLLPGRVDGGGGMGLGDALMIQLGEDGVEWPRA